MRSVMCCPVKIIAQVIWIAGWIIAVLGNNQGPDASVTCIYTQDCILPCSSGYHDVIHWHKADHVVHSYYQSKDQLGYQNPDFVGRTSLFPDQILKGNLSLLLRRVKTTDNGKYKCYTADKINNKEFFVNLSVTALIKAADIQFMNDTVRCNTSQVFPEPKISWSVDGLPTTAASVVNLARDEDGLVSLDGTLNIPVHLNRTYKCSISLQDPNQTYTVSIRKEKVQFHLRENATIHCPSPEGDTEHYNLSLLFDGYTTVMSYVSSGSPPPDTMRMWRDTEVRLAGRGIVTIQTLDKEKHDGTYRCETVTRQSRQIVETQLVITSDPPWTVIIVAIVGIVAGIAGIACIVACISRRKRTIKKSHNQNKLLNHPNVESTKLKLMNKA